jgi:hypothetical protein
MGMTTATIPPITDPQGKDWEQPPIWNILLDDKFACMSLKTLHELAEYNCSLPSGVYDGKMWRREIHTNPYGHWSPEEGDQFLYHMLCWYGPSDDPNKCSVHQRVIMLTD